MQRDKKIEQAVKDLKTSNESMSSRKSDLKKHLKYLRDRDREKVRGVFHYHERRGGHVKFNYYGYDGDKVETYTLYDGQTYELPRGVAVHLNTNPMRAVYDWVKDESGNDVCMIVNWARRCSFDSMEFFNDEALKSAKSTHIIQIAH